jgi:hypothetical protein
VSSRATRRNVGKLDQKRKTRQRVQIGIDKIKLAKGILTSSREGVVEPPASKFLLISILCLFGEDARGLATGVDISRSWWRESEGPSAAQLASERTKVFDVLVGAVILPAGSSSSSSPLSRKKYGDVHEEYIKKLKLTN